MSMHLAKSFALAIVTIGLTAAPALAADPTGTWQSTGGESRYKVTYCGDGTQLCAKLTWLRDDARTKDNLAYLNRYVVKGAVPSGKNRWEGRVAYDGDVFEGSVTMASANSMKVKGCKGMFCKSMSFTRQ
jgi:uncharacterized protein (DUF2147 family)